MTAQNLLFDWSVDPVVVAGLLLTALLYARGVRYARAHGLARHWHGGQAVAFFAGLYLLFIALDSGIDVWASRYLWVHMVQHEVLVLVVAPLLLLGAPLMPLWRAVPVSARRATLLWAIKHRWPWRWGRDVGRLFGSPWVAGALFAGAFLFWHLPPLYDLALQQHGVHILEHATFLGTALAFWAAVIPSWPLRPRMSCVARALYLSGAALWMNVLNGFFIFSTGVLYPYYAALPRSLGGLSLLEDQHIAGAVMDVPGTAILVVFVMVLLGLWLQEDERAGVAERATA
jgi:putative membrane protein